MKNPSIEPWPIVPLSIVRKISTDRGRRQSNRRRTCGSLSPTFLYKFQSYKNTPFRIPWRKYRVQSVYTSYVIIQNTSKWFHGRGDSSCFVMYFLWYSFLMFLKTMKSIIEFWNGHKNVCENYYIQNMYFLRSKRMLSQIFEL